MEAILGHYAQAENNPESGLYDGRMLEAADLWCWDARPYPAFPALDDIWADASAWNAGHWLNGRLVGAWADLIAAVLRRGGVEDFTVTGVEGTASGYVIDRPMRTREALAPLLTAFDVVAAERNGACRRSVARGPAVSRRAGRGSPRPSLRRVDCITGRGGPPG
ncbi:baseplate megatron protein TIM-barrel domain-containing protein [Brevundimonas sp. UBA7534]|uniref:baseplate megatron protein TIM-barrel domain-containing protein n=1 Tax=Brevundimonas sp. UBA7534 TaxID=1946138 RepID=UPI0025BCBAB6|nr:glycoside hydrolase TIM-barrel-like domain-containing protein [Brevundimonas sp. UBA7534]